MFPDVREAVSKLIDPSRLRVISFSHFESDECGALQEWLAVAPRTEGAAQPAVPLDAFVAATVAEACVPGGEP